MSLRSVLVAANAFAWVAFVLVREPLSDSWFAERDAAQRADGFIMSSSDPLIVLAGRPLRVWGSHGGESAPVRAMTAANAVPLFVVVMTDAFVWATGWVPTHLRSVLALAALLLLASAQWWLLGTAAARFLAWRQERKRTAA